MTGSMMRTILRRSTMVIVAIGRRGNTWMIGIAVADNGEELDDGVLADRRSLTIAVCVLLVT